MLGHLIYARALLAMPSCAAAEHARVPDPIPPCRDVDGDGRCAHSRAAGADGVCFARRGRVARSACGWLAGL